MSHYLQSFEGLPEFSKVKVAEIEPTIKALLQSNRQAIAELLKQDEFTWDSFVVPMENLSDRVSKSWSPVSHMKSVVSSDELREAYERCLPELSAYSTELSQNPAIYNAYESIKNSSEFSSLNAAQQKLINDALRDFRLAGVSLEPDKQARFKEIMQELSQLNSKFSNNVLDATQAWTREVSDKNELAGLPDYALAMAQQAAQQRDKSGWLVTLEPPSFIAIMQFADNRALRHDVYMAYTTRASDQGPHANQYDNSDIIQRILELRHEAAAMLGFASYAEYSLATKMADTPQQVLDFLYDLADRAHPAAEKELAELKAFATEKLGLDELQAWDIAYASEKFKIANYNLSQEELKPYFPEQKVLDGLFSIVQRLYKISIKERKDIDTWHADVRFFEIFDRDGKLRGQFYLDMYARQFKNGGAWMGECLSRKHMNGETQTPVAYLVCNLTPPIGDDPALFTHDEVTTLFHEFGHGLHHMLTQVDYPSVSGINGVAWDAVELPSQFMENFCWEWDAISDMTSHYKTGESMPRELFDRLYRTKNFQSAMQTVRQLEFALFDFRLHHEYQAGQKSDIQKLLNEVRERVAVVKRPQYDRTAHAFSHIFAGGYAAGYYSYKWAEVLSADAYAAFEETGVFNEQTGQKFMKSILEQGGSREPMELFVEFRGREPTIEAFLRHSGLQ